MRLFPCVLVAGSLAVWLAACTAEGRRAPDDPAAPRGSGAAGAVVGEFRGYHDGAFEYSGFVPCRDRSGIPAAHPVRSSVPQPEVWVTIIDTAGMPARPWPTRQIAGRLRLYDRAYVRLRGTLVGPGRYGHFAMAQYELRVDSVLQVARTGPPCC